MFGIAAFSEAPFSSLGGVAVVVALIGVSATGNVGTVTANGTANIFPTGVFATSALGTVVVAAEAIAVVTGVQAYGLLGQVNVWGQINDNQNANWGTINDSQSAVWTQI